MRIRVENFIYKTVIMKFNLKKKLSIVFFIILRSAYCNADTTYEIIHRSGLSENRFDLIFIGDRFFENEMDDYEDQVSKIWHHLSTEHQFWRRYKKFFNVYRIDLISPSFSPDTKGVRNSALGINLKAVNHFFYGMIRRL